jgi:hypothetical protein
MEANDAEHVTFVDEFAGRRFDNKVEIPEDWVHITPGCELMYSWTDAWNRISRFTTI